ncbi:hypothetical protein NHL50_06695 [Acidimicrobiia bacterium EGI L10123]|uniref:hypothetical protein n=1 Tax=Salinilacustrithrix flava TaxID=2957203 RepID=UPI003D7C22E6|nr:hypothetical protein [Acidimicrobiia bacterium EGI L10123]
MVAIASLPTTVTTPGRAHRAPAHRPGPGDRRPALRLVPPVGSDATTSSRRSLASVVGAALLALAVVLAVGYLATTPTTSPAAGLDGTHVVAEGDSMWSVAVAHAPAGEAAAYVERLVDLNGGAAVTPGQELLLPSR